MGVSKQYIAITNCYCIWPKWSQGHRSTRRQVTSRDRQKATPTYPGRSIETINTMQSEGQHGLIAQKGQVGGWLTGVSCQRPRRHQVCHRTVHVVSVLCGYTWHHMPCCTSIYIVLHVSILYSACTWQGPIRLKPRSCIWVMKSLSDVVNDSEDCSGVMYFLYPC